MVIVIKLAIWFTKRPKDIHFNQDNRFHCEQYMIRYMCVPLSYFAQVFQEAIKGVIICWFPHTYTGSSHVITLCIHASSLSIIGLQQHTLVLSLLVTSYVSGGAPQGGQGGRPPPQLEHWGGIAPPNFRLQYKGVPKSPLLSLFCNSVYWLKPHNNVNSRPPNLAILPPPLRIRN